MELKDKQRSLVNRTPGKENAYENTELNRSGLSLIHVEENEYEVLRRSTGSRSDHTGSEKAPFNPSKRLIYVLVGLVVFLYLAAAAVAVVLIMPKGGGTIFYCYIFSLSSNRSFNIYNTNYIPSEKS